MSDLRKKIAEILNNIYQLSQHNQMIDANIEADEIISLVLDKAIEVVKKERLFEDLNNPEDTAYSDGIETAIKAIEKLKDNDN